MRSFRLCWAFFSQPVIYNRGVRKSNDFKYPWEPFPCPAEWSSFSSPAGPLPTGHWPRIPGRIHLLSLCSRNAICMVCCVKGPARPKQQNISSIISHLPDLFVHSFTHFIQQIFIEGLLCIDIILVLRIHEWTDQEKKILCSQCLHSVSATGGYSVWILKRSEVLWVSS